MRQQNCGPLHECYHHICSLWLLKGAATCGDEKARISYITTCSGDVQSTNTSLNPDAEGL